MMTVDYYLTSCTLDCIKSGYITVNSCIWLWANGSDFVSNVFPNICNLRGLLTNTLNFRYSHGKKSLQFQPEDLAGQDSRSIHNRFGDYGKFFTHWIASSRKKQKIMSYDDNKMEQQSLSSDVTMFPERFISRNNNINP